MDDVCSAMAQARCIKAVLQTYVKFESANRTAFVLSVVLFVAGYFVNLPKSCLFPTWVVQLLGVIVDSARAMFFFTCPPNKVDKFMSLIKDLLCSETIF